MAEGVGQVVRGVSGVRGVMEGLFPAHVEIETLPQNLQSLQVSMHVLVIAIMVHTVCTTVEPLSHNEDTSLNRTPFPTPSEMRTPH